MTKLQDMSEAQRAELLSALTTAIGGNNNPEVYGQFMWQLRGLVGWKRYWGTSSLPTLDAAGIVGLQNVDPFCTTMRTALQMDRVGAPAEYFYYAYPMRLGGFEWVYCGPPPNWTNISPVMSDVTIEDELGIGIDYAVCRSPSKIAGSIRFKVS